MPMVQEGLDGLAKLLRRGEALVAIARHRLAADASQLGRDAHQRWGRTAEGRADGFHHLALVQALAGRDLVQDCAQLVDVGARVDAVAGRDGLLRGHVAGCTHHGLDVGSARHPRGHLGLQAGGQAPVDQIHLAEAAEHHVVGLDVEVHHPAHMGKVHCLADAAEHA